MALPVLLVVVVISAVLAGPLAGPLPNAATEDAVVEAAEDEAAAAALCPARCVCRLDASPKLVNCSARKLREFPAAEDVPEDVEYLDLSDNLLEAVPKYLPAWEHLEVLSLAGNRLTDFPPRALADMPALELLDLSRNRISSLRRIKADRFIAENPRLQVLNLSGNALQDLGHGSFQSLSSESLRVLDVSHCAVSSVNGEEALRELPSLRELRLAGNPLPQLPVMSAPALRDLDVSACHLRAVSARALRALPRLEHLSVSHNEELAEFLPPPSPTPSPGDLLAHYTNSTEPWSTSLLVLEAEGCALQDLSFLGALPNLTEVRLRGNSIGHMDALDLVASGAVLHLDLADNKLEDLPEGVFKGTPLLKELDLSGNRITAIHPEAFAQNAFLRQLNVSRNPVASLKLSAPALRVLDASHAEVQLLTEDILDGMPQLRHLNLSHNPLPKLPDHLASPGLDASLHSLDLSFCRLDDVSVTVLDALPLLQTLDMRGNRLTEPLKVECFNENPILHRILLGDNPWRCDCRSKAFQNFVGFLQKHPVKDDVTTLACHSPEDAAGQTWYDACLSPDATSSLASLHTWVFVVILALCVALVTGGFVAVRLLRRGKARRRRQRRQDDEDERRSCEEQAETRRLHRTMQQQQQQELRRQSMRTTPVNGGDPEAADTYDPPSYEEAVLMDRLTQDDGSSADEQADDQRRASKTIRRLSGRHTPVMEEEEEESEGRGEEDPEAEMPEAAPSGSNGASGVNRSNGNATKLHTKL